MRFKKDLSDVCSNPVEVSRPGYTKSVREGRWGKEQAPERASPLTTRILRSQF